MAVVLEGLDARPDASLEPDGAAVRKRPVEQQRAHRQQPSSHLEKVIEHFLLLDLPSQRLREVGEKRQARLPGLGGSLREVEISDVDRHHLDQGLVDHWVHHRLHLGVEPMHVAVRVLDPNQLLP